MSTEKKSAASAVKEPTFSKDSILNSKRFRDECDLLSAILKDDVDYTISEVDKLITDYMKGKVN